MKRSEINEIQRNAKKFLEMHSFYLPAFAYWGPKDWASCGPETDEIKKCMLGWDITDFGSNDFYKRGLFLFTMRNGNLSSYKDKVYAEKIMIVEENQETPMHFHRFKMEDIINRGGGDLCIQLYNSTKGEALSDEDLVVSVDGIRKNLKAGETVRLHSGESICLKPFLYHRFWAEGGTCLVGEVSMTNDDTADNRFLENLGRFPKIEEDEPIMHLLSSDYPYIPNALKI
ncbi:MAG TPA: D-lyxose/D-mannose family sugar isomerase [Sphaerochaeta sp.]|nr:D-lyxose/D-mannose family sugar isomerase [Sphaerochaeta sp.]